jgi:tetratricopeptide (TPR) repeat protein
MQRMSRLKKLLVTAWLVGAGTAPSVSQERAPSTGQPELTPQLQAEFHIELGEFAEAQAVLGAAIEAISSDGDRALLADYLASLGRALEADGQYLRSLQNYTEARDLIRREYGLFDEQVVELLGLMQSAAGRAGEIELAFQYRAEAQRTAWRALEIEAEAAAEAHGYGSAEYLEQRLRVAEWLARQRMLFPPPGTDFRSPIRRFDVEDAYDELLKLVKREFDHDPALQVRVLREMANLSGAGAGGFFGGYTITLRRTAALLEAEKIAGKMNDPELHAAVLRDIGDWRLLTGRYDLALDAYTEAWHRLEPAENSDALQHELLGVPVVIRPMSSYFVSGILSDDPEAPEAHVELEFIINEFGLTSMVRAVSAEPEWIGDIAVQAISRTRFRPRVANGKTVVSAAYDTWSFRYRPEQEESR